MPFPRPRLYCDYPEFDGIATEAPANRLEGLANIRNFARDAKASQEEILEAVKKRDENLAAKRAGRG